MRHTVSRSGDMISDQSTVRFVVLSKRLATAPVIALTATATDKVRTDIVRSLGIEDCAEFKKLF